MDENIDPTYSIIFDIDKNKKIESRAFIAGMKEFLDALQEINNVISCGINSEIKVVSYIQNIEAGSIKIKLKDFVKDNIETIGLAGYEAYHDKYYGSAIVLVIKLAKKIILKVKNQKNNSNDEIIENTIKKIETLMKDYGITKGDLLDSNPEIDKNKLRKALIRSDKAIKKTGKSIYYQSDDESEKILLEHPFADESEDDLEGNETTQEVECEMRIKKPDLEGNKQWQCYFMKNIKVSIEDEIFLQRIKKGLGVSSKTILKVKLKIIYTLDDKKKAIDKKTKYVVTEVIDIIQPLQNREFNFNNHK